MNDNMKIIELHEESIVDDDIVIVVTEEEDHDYDYDFIEFMDCVQRKTICIISVLFVGTILLVFLRTII